MCFLKVLTPPYTWVSCLLKVETERSVAYGIMWRCYGTKRARGGDKEGSATNIVFKTVVGTQPFLPLSYRYVCMYFKHLELHQRHFKLLPKCNLLHGFRVWSKSIRHPSKSIYSLLHPCHVADLSLLFLYWWNPHLQRKSVLYCSDLGGGMLFCNKLTWILQIKYTTKSCQNNRMH